jgi:hypothetical protein
VVRHVANALEERNGKDTRETVQAIKGAQAQTVLKRHSGQVVGFLQLAVLVVSP